MTAVLATSDGAGLEIETLPAMPGLAGLYAKGAASSGLIAAGRALPAIPGLGSGTPAAEDGALTLPGVVHRVANVPTAGLRTHLRDYQRLLHEPVSELLPAGYLHVLAFPLATSVMVRGDFPLPLLGMVHLANDASLLRPVTLGDVLEVRAWAERLRPHRRGVQLDVVAEIRVGDEVAWRGASTYLARGFEVPDDSADPAGTAGSAGSAVEDRAPAGTWAPPLPTGRWALAGGTGRAYAAISGDRNPIHLSALSAKAFGFPRAIAHGMYTAARALAEVGPGHGTTYRWTVEFGKPVLLPGTVDVAITPSDDGFAYVGWNAGRRLRHFTGAVTPL
ncbi:MaoC domain protein dehydratase [Xylanimonas cellulosilytica DSM 15894]|uniref:MaoC domain protein dehydratase n=1 Tax=Xylanimonas cellulosilytica (strain DSM 15894 / JCM 12276 / CECT 5975 / KCTC 9989 / LMG 20990 / NBRC 107835 / XIL07) TaxID=446471 RepID=D1BZY8_XYLCX|nr:MaoC/PaaZ C-terminal domain-containing protein [Xylanimonas cellulosilytica]ACZ32116.1 MaoC domain protein dehydratase [Xylanimonas cellulosilytica DSM 15894]